MSTLYLFIDLSENTSDYGKLIPRNPLRYTGRVLKEVSRTGKLPSVKKISPILLSMGKAAIKNPVRAIKDGIVNDNIARKLAGNISRKAIVKSGVKKLAANKDLVVNTGGYLGSKVGKAATLGNPVGGYAGDLGGALITRKAIDDIAATKKVLKSKGGIKKAFLTPTDTVKQLRSTAKKTSSPKIEYAKDGIGWAIGNSAADTVLSPTGVPLRGSIAAGLGMRPTIKAIKRLRKGKGVRHTVKQGTKDVKRSVSGRIRLLRKNTNKIKTSTEKNYLQKPPVSTILNITGDYLQGKNK